MAWETSIISINNFQLNGENWKYEKAFNFQNI